MKHASARGEEFGALALQIKLQHAVTLVRKALRALNIRQDFIRNKQSTESVA